MKKFYYITQGKEEYVRYCAHHPKEESCTLLPCPPIWKEKPKKEKISIADAKKTLCIIGKRTLYDLRRKNGKEKN